MNKLTHLKETKSFLRKVISCRRNLLRNNYGKKPSDALVSSKFEIDYKLSSINNFDTMMKFIENHQVQYKIKNIIPSNKDSWREMLDVLIYRGLVLQGKITRYEGIMDQSSFFDSPLTNDERAALWNDGNGLAYSNW